MDSIHEQHYGQQFQNNLHRYNSIPTAGHGQGQSSNIYLQSQPTYATQPLMQDRVPVPQVLTGEPVSGGKSINSYEDNQPMPNAYQKYRKSGEAGMSNIPMNMNGINYWNAIQPNGLYSDMVAVARQDPTLIENKEQVSQDIEIRIRDTQIQSLQNEIRELKTKIDQSLTYSSKVTRPKQAYNITSIFQKLSQAVQEKEKEIDKTKRTLDSVLVAMALDPEKSVSRYGSYDLESLSQRLVQEIEALSNENADLGKLLTFQKSKEDAIELGLLYRENTELRKELGQFTEH